jgi:hypothetical protein
MAGASVMQRALWLLCGLAISIKGTHSVLFRFMLTTCIDVPLLLGIQCLHMASRLQCHHLLCHIDMLQEGMPHPVPRHI